MLAAARDVGQTTSENSSEENKFEVHRYRPVSDAARAVAPRWGSFLQ